jgi:PAS domain S-box-containing protein
MKLNSISIRSRLSLLLAGSVLFWLLAGFLTLSMIENLGRHQGICMDIGMLPRKILRLENSIHSFYANDLYSETFQESGRSDAVSGFSSTYLDVYTDIREMGNDPVFTGDPVFQRKLDHLLEYLGNTDSYLETILEKSRERGWRDFGLCGILKDQIRGIDPGSLSGYTKEGQELIPVLGAYLDSPTSTLQTSLLTRANNLESYLSGTARDRQVRDADLISMEGFLSNLQELIQLDLELGITRYEGLQSRLFRMVDVLYDEANALAALFRIKHETKIRRIRWGIISVAVISALVYGIVLTIFSRSLFRHLRTISESVKELVSGRFPDGLPERGNNELSEISRRLNGFIESLRNKAGFAAELAEGKNTRLLEGLSPDDSLANSLINLEKSLQASRLEEEKHRKSQEERRWTNEGIARFGDLLRIHSKDISSLADNVIQELVKYLNASAGGFFLLNNTEEGSELDLIAAFAFDRKKYLKQKYRIGEGLVGTCAIEKQKIFLTEIPGDYIQISSGLGASKPSCLLLMPLKLEEDILGVIELASIQLFADYEIDFVEHLAESIASAVSTVQMNMRTARLLEQSQEQAREMAKQEEIMRQNMEELQATQEESARRESEISGILNGIHNSAYVAEFNMDEELLTINDKFLQLLESQRSQLIGKKYNEIMGISRHTDSYKKFWQDITGGKTVTRIDKVAILTGQDVWLRQTFTPIVDKDGNPFKVLNITADITETVEQKESLEKQSAEIARANIEMKSFSDAVDQALIKCVYSPAGQILELNENFENVTGFTAKEMLGKNNRVFLQRVEKEQFDRIWEDILKDKPYSGVIRRTKPTGEEVWLMSTFTPVKDENGNIFKVFFLGQDITERKLKYQLLEEANREIERLRRQLEEPS